MTNTAQIKIDTTGRRTKLPVSTVRAGKARVYSLPADVYHYREIKVKQRIGNLYSLIEVIDNELKVLRDGRVSEVPPKVVEKARPSVVDSIDEHDQRLVDVIKRVTNKQLSFADCFRVNPIRASKSVLGILGAITSASLVLSLVVHVHLLNPIAAILGLVASTGFYGMVAFVERKESNRGSGDR